MRNLLVLVGPIGAGKTALAESLDGHRRVYFDAEWHGAIQPNGNDPRKMVVHVGDIAHRTDTDIVVDGWWTWGPRWWETKDDETLDELSNYVQSHDVRPVYLPLSVPRAIAAHYRKHATGAYMGQPPELSDPKLYARTVPARIEYLARKVGEWVK